MNCHGLANDKKREDVLLYLKSKQYDACCIQDTHFTSDIETEICRKWGGKCFFSLDIHPTLEEYICSIEVWSKL